MHGRTRCSSSGANFCDFMSFACLLENRVSWSAEVPCNNKIKRWAQPEILKETTADSEAWSTQAAESQSEKESQNIHCRKIKNGYKWKLCNVTAGPDYIPCLDNEQAIKKLPSTYHYEHRERHCSAEAPTCLVSVPEGYKQLVRWPRSREHGMELSLDAK
ncbi:hypothetical protein RJ639_019084 [Escallonia herrerae]|uniref:Methyltransferase n=1 Tax=Escallonia herrerae TaxID=1293975 RepID=A0AA88V9L0_9ASTE|nr:hypothetical protein RJ639_019084 [Escallonia herrerae]